MNQYPTILSVSPEMQHLNSDPCPDFLRQLSSGVLTMSHTARDAKFPYPGHWGGRFTVNSHVSLPYVVLESPNSILT